MMGKSHAKMAGVTWIGAMAVGHSFGLSIGGYGMVVSTLAAVSAGIAPDIDHPQSSTTRNLGPIGSMCSWAVRKMAFGHRGLTHSIGAVAFVTYAMVLTVAATRFTPIPLAIALGLLTATALDIMPKVPEGAEWVAGALVGTSAGAIVDSMPIWVLPAAVAWGWHMHLICDRCTIEKFPYWWPLRPRTNRTAWKMFRTGSTGERITVRLTICMTALLTLRFGLPS